MACVSEFPFLDVDEFQTACNQLLHLLPDSKLLDNFTGLRIPRCLGSGTVASDVDQEHDMEILEQDDEVAPVYCEKEALVYVDYDIVLSPSYRVPVLYMTIKPPCSVSQVFDLLVPFQFRNAVSETGIMGALSMTDHPATGMPAYFVHPCRTADAMRATGMQNVSATDYMLIWMGIIGASVGLNVPSTNMLRAV